MHLAHVQASGAQASRPRLASKAGGDAAQGAATLCPTSSVTDRRTKDGPAPQLLSQLATVVQRTGASPGALPFLIMELPAELSWQLSWQIYFPRPCGSPGRLLSHCVTNGGVKQAASRKGRRCRAAALSLQHGVPGGSWGAAGDARRPAAGKGQHNPKGCSNSSIPA